MCQLEFDDYVYVGNYTLEDVSVTMNGFGTLTNKKYKYIGLWKNDIFVHGEFISKMYKFKGTFENINKPLKGTITFSVCYIEGEFDYERENPFGNYFVGRLYKDQKLIEENSFLLVLLETITTRKLI